jgi:hypothetical protein
VAALPTEVSRDDPGLAALPDEVSPDDAGESGLDEITSSVFVTRLDGHVTAAAGWCRWLISAFDRF